MEKKYVTANNWTVTVKGKRFKPSPSPYEPIFVKGLDETTAKSLLAKGMIREFVMPAKSEALAEAEARARAAEAKAAELEKQLAELQTANKKESVGADKPIEKMTRAELMAELSVKGVQFTARENLMELQTLLKDARKAETNPEAGTETDNSENPEQEAP